MSEDKDDKQFDASEQKLRKAREKGDVPRSTELNAAAMYIGIWLALAVSAGFAVRSWTALATTAIGSDGWPRSDTFDLATALGVNASLAITGLIAVPAVTVVLGLLGQRALVFSGQKLAPDLKRIDPFKNAKQKFGTSGLVTFAISLGKAALVCAGGWYLFDALLGVVTNSALMREGQWMLGIPLILQRVLILAIVVSAAFAIVDMLWKRHEHLKQNRMSRREVEDEHKDSEGDPHLKAARRQKAVEIATSQMLSDVERADVVIVNPTHYAVALEWKRGSGRAPVCLAKGVDDVAARIRERATEHGVPIWSDPPCARALHATVDLGAEIQPDQFAPVAAAIRFAEKMRARARSGW
ncbi:flagellar type III secretion system protein FlhB [Paracoccus sp. TK19116]|uniref:Flagellar type III secretion system protein FlhB n=1 Tax=Paracoccus albicereus TaxID=2922394 RepID=A0ABT1MW30_9RHOB|nr:flagellar type III secretion system protein FlhB [Paracoccus albicereus]MCQ0971056.1 flagellar type III secretion system protein FlhB [Paracoccus albicereus]